MMIQLKRVLVPTDFSEFSENALRYGCELAERFGGELHILHVLTSPLVGFAEESGSHYSKSFAEYEQDLRDTAQNRLKDVDTSLISGPERVTHTVRVGAPFVEIIQCAKANDIDMIVMGTHGRTGLKHMLMGSVAERVVRKAPCPVMTIHHPEHEFVEPEAD